jgi:hypothetical protein
VARRGGPGEGLGLTSAERVERRSGRLGRRTCDLGRRGAFVAGLLGVGEVVLVGLDPLLDVGDPAAQLVELALQL